MPKQGILPVLADLYNPALVLLSLVCISLPTRQRQWKHAGLLLAGFIGIAVIAYGIRYLDDNNGLWMRFGLDYSTHTATSLGMVIFLSFAVPRHWKVLSLSFVSYALLMMHLGYHTAMDILTTGVTVALLGAAWLKVLNQRDVDAAERPVGQPQGS